MLEEEFGPVSQEMVFRGKIYFSERWNIYLEGENLFIINACKISFSNLHKYYSPPEIWR